MENLPSHEKPKLYMGWPEIDLLWKNRAIQVWCIVSSSDVKVSALLFTNNICNDSVFSWIYLWRLDHLLCKRLSSLSRLPTADGQLPSAKECDVATFHDPATTFTTLAAKHGRFVRLRATNERETTSQRGRRHQQTNNGYFLY